MFNPSILKLYFTTVLSLGVCHMFHSDIPQNKSLMISGRHSTETSSTPRVYKYTIEQQGCRENLGQFVLAGQDELQTVSWFWPHDGPVSPKPVDWNPGCPVESPEKVEKHYYPGPTPRDTDLFRLSLRLWP